MKKPAQSTQQDFVKQLAALNVAARFIADDASMPTSEKLASFKRLGEAASALMVELRREAKQLLGN